MQSVRPRYFQCLLFPSLVRKIVFSVFLCLKLMAVYYTVIMYFIHLLTCSECMTCSVLLAVTPSREPGWLEGELEGKRGLIPQNYVEILQQMD